MAIRVKYELSQAGQRAEAAAGRPAHEERELVVEPPYPIELVQATSFDSKGEGQVTLRRMPKLQETSEKATVHSADRNVSTHAFMRYMRLWSSMSLAAFDGLLDVHGAVAHLCYWLATSERLEGEAKASYEAARDTAFAEAEAELPTAIAQYEANQERERQEKQEKQEREQERQEWIEEYGSSHLKKAVAAGYNCQRLYVTERAGVEFPGFTVDFDDEAKWRDRACPSERALDLAAQHDGATVVWLTHRKFEDWGDEEEWDPCEAVIIRGYLGKYDLVQEIPLWT